MARPKTPLISRRKALEAALHIVDTEGLNALSIRRLGDALNVNGASLYHHFHNKEDILVGVTQLALAEVTSPRATDESWRVWMPQNAYRTREALISHPELIPIMLRRASMGIGSEALESSILRLKEEGVPMGAIAPILESLELLAISSALKHVGDAKAASVDTPAGEEPSLRAQAAAARTLSSEETFELLVAAVLSSVENAVYAREARNSSGKRAARA